MNLRNLRFRFAKAWVCAANRKNLANLHVLIVGTGPSCKEGKGALLTLTERMTRQEIIRKLPDRKQKSVIKALWKLRKLYKFKTVTADNGSEFLDFKDIEKALKCKVYYAHPYSSWERRSNENANGIIRLFLPKGTDFSKISTAEIKAIESWLNDYPRHILGGISANKAAAVALTKQRQ